MQDEGELIRRAATGDPEAVNELVRTKREMVVRVAYQVVGNWEDAVDVSQGVFVRLWKGLGRYDPSRRFDTWLHRVTVNAAIDWVRSRGKHLQPLPDEPSRLPGQTTQPTVERDLDVENLREVFSKLSARLAPKQRTAFVLREIEGVDTAEVARIMNVTESTVRNHLLQARRALRAGIEREYPHLVPVRSESGEGER
jgi:RNA polymerase sigma-70 factor (ECF subfamily)